MIVVKEEFVALAILRLVEMEKVVCEGAGAVGLAAVLSGQLPELKGKKYVVLLDKGISGKIEKWSSKTFPVI